ncbi:hypothetical protein [Methylobacterium brachiatum]|uniref:hypothetical protein n=1 Tax=Methylobacterium brachiatum TaxID=269660 RepID=UPI00244A7B54|nr:hypothetical protein [Methylobacterium brachiatum]MDH2311420.1 hypothetical protein [Methylobacterium brachiatum]
MIAPVSTAALDEATTAAEQAAEALIDALVDGAQSPLDKLSGVAEALGGDQHFAATTADKFGAVDSKLAAVDSELADVNDTLATKADRARKVTVDGLATGGGDLTADIEISVPKATADQAKAGTDNATVITPALLNAVIAYLFSQPGVLSALLPTSPPSQAGVPWLNGTVVSIS